MADLVEQEPRQAKDEDSAVHPLTHARSESQMPTPLDENGVTPKGLGTQLVEPKSAAAKLAQDRLDGDKKGEETQTNKESQKLSFSSKIGLPLHISLGNPDAPANTLDKSPGRTNAHLHAHIQPTTQQYLASTHGAPSYPTIAF